MMMTKARIQVSQCVDWWQRKYQITRQISDWTKTEFKAPINRESCQEHLDKLGDRGKSTAKTIFNILGVECLTITPYQIIVSIGQAFRWNEDGIHAHIMDILANRLSCEDIEIIETKLEDYKDITEG